MHLWSIFLLYASLGFLYLHRISLHSSNDSRAIMNNFHINLNCIINSSGLPSVHGYVTIPCEQTTHTRIQSFKHQDLVFSTPASPCNMLSINNIRSSPEPNWNYWSETTRSKFYYSPSTHTLFPACISPSRIHPALLILNAKALLPWIQIVKVVRLAKCVQTCSYLWHNDNVSWFGFLCKLSDSLLQGCNPVRARSPT